MPSILDQIMDQAGAASAGGEKVGIGQSSLAPRQDRLFNAGLRDQFFQALPTFSRSVNRMMSRITGQRRAPEEETPVLERESSDRIKIEDMGKFLERGVLDFPTDPVRLDGPPPRQPTVQELYQRQLNK